MKKVIIFHGTDCSPESVFYWYSWLRKELEKSGCVVELPYYPSMNHEAIETFLPKVLESHVINEDTILVGHSAGSPLILSILEKIEVKIPLAVLVAGYSMRLPGEQRDPILQETYEWEKIKQQCSNFVFINSVNDPWGCDDKQGRILFDHLGGTQIIRNDGHFGSESQNLPYVEFPLLKDMILELAQ